METKTKKRKEKENVPLKVLPDLKMYMRDS